jgi:hypothetical protein
METLLNVYHRMVLIEKYLFKVPENNNENVINNNVPVALEPKKNNRFVVEFPNDFDIETWLFNKVTKPKFNTLNNKWCDVEIVLIDTIGPSASQKIYTLLKWCSKRKQYLAEQKIYEELFDFSIFSLDPTGIRVEQWIISVADIEFCFGTGDYGSDDLATVKLTIKPKNCVLVF